MFHSTWDIEVYARHMREAAERTAAAERLAATAQAGHGRHAPASELRRAASRMVAWISRNGAVSVPPAPQAEAPEPQIALIAMDPAPAPVRPPRLAPRAADPYAGMLVLARNRSLAAAEEPCGVPDC